MKYKIGDRVRIKSLDWYNENKDENIDFNTPLVLQMTSKMSLFCDDVVTIKEVNYNYYSIYEDNNTFCWTDEMIEGLVEEDVDLIPKFGEFSDNEPLDIPTVTTDFIKEHGLPCPEGYIFKDENGNVINATKIVLEKKKKEYPKTYCECKDILGLWDIDDTERGYYKTDLIDKLQMLLICRDAYWKIAGDEMRFGKSWEPDYDSLKTKYTIVVVENKVVKLHTLSQNRILIFPTEEMRDAFYENFKELIEQCKELL